MARHFLDHSDVPFDVSLPSDAHQVVSSHPPSSAHHHSVGGGAASESFGNEHRHHSAMPLMNPIATDRRGRLLHRGSL